MESIRAFGSKFFSFRVDLILEGGGGVAGGGGKNDKASQAVQPPCIRK